MIPFSIGSFSFHRLLGEGKQDIFQYIRDCKQLGCTHLQPWNAHFTRQTDIDEVVKLGRNPGLAELPEWAMPPQDPGYLREIRSAAEEAGMPFECIAVDRAHIYEEDPEQRETNRSLAYLWLDIAESLGALSLRIDAGGPEDMPDPAFRAIVEGYEDLIARGKDKGIRILTENHWGPSQRPDNVVKLLDTIEGLGFLFDTHNWAEGQQRRGWELCAPYADSTHFKTFSFDEEGNEPSVDLAVPIRLLLDSGYDGVWGVESVPENGDEMDAARKTMELIRRTIEAD